MRHHNAQRLELLVHHLINRQGYVGHERIGLLETIGGIQEDWVVLERRHIGTDKRHRHHVSRILHEDARVAVVGMIVVGAMADDDVGLPLADETDDFAAVLQCRLQLAVVNVEDLHGDAQHFCRRFHFGFAPQEQGPSGLPPVTNVAIGDGNELHAMPLPRPQSSGAAGSDFAIVRVCAEADDAEFAILGRHGGRGREHRAGCECRQHAAARMSHSKFH